MDAERYIQVGKARVELPPGVTLADWALERTKFQNPRIRSYLGCIRMIEEVNDSNYAFLHCSPTRLLKIWSQFRRVCQLIRSEIVPTLREPSIFPELDSALGNADDAFEEIARGVVVEVEQYSDQPTGDEAIEVRKLLCVSVGKLYAFLRDTFGAILAADPRSQRDSDYFLSKSFAKEIEESEWLYSSVYELNGHVSDLHKLCSVEFERVLSNMRTDRMIPHQATWDRAKNLVEKLVDELIPELKQVLSHRSIRLSEIETLDGYAFEIPHRCRALVEVYEAGREIIEKIKASAGEAIEEREQSVRDLMSCHEVVIKRMIGLVSGIDKTVQELARFVPVWLAAIEKRRCLMLTKNPAEIPPRPPRFVHEKRERAERPAPGRSGK
jgi:hypothetical protein